MDQTQPIGRSVSPSPSSSPRLDHRRLKVKKKLGSLPKQTTVQLVEPNIASLSLKEVSSRGLDASPITPQVAEEDKFFLTEGKIRRSSGEDSDYTDFADENGSLRKSVRLVYPVHVQIVI